MKIGEVGKTFTNTIKIEYRSNRTFIDFDVLILDYNHILGNQGVNDGKLFQQRKDALSEFLEHKKVPLIITAQNPMHPNFVFDNKNVSMSEVLPIKSFQLVSQRGETIEIVPGSKFSDFFKKYISYFHYTSYFSEFSGNPLLETPHTKKAISFINAECLILPPFRRPLQDKEDQFLIELIELISNLKKDVSKAELPQWTINYHLPNEKETKVEIQDIENQLQKLNDRLDERSKYLSDLALKKL
jgi:hypothetical protein